MNSTDTQHHHRIENSFPEDEPAQHVEGSAEYTVAFIPDSRASTVALAETVKHLINARSVSRGIVELNTAAGITVAAQLYEQKIAFDVMVFDNAEDEDLEPEGEPARLHAAAAQHISVSPEELHELDANYIVIPAISGAGERRIDLAVDGNVGVDIGETTLPGHVMKSLQEKAETTGITEEVLYIDTPERGLVQEADGTYQRRILHLEMGDEAQASQ